MIRNYLIVFPALFTALYAGYAGISHAGESTISAGVGYDTLSGDYSDWQNQYIRGSHDFTERLSVFASLVRYERFSTSDMQYSANLSYQASQRVNISAWAGFTTDAVFRPEQTYGTQIYTAHRHSGGIAAGFQSHDWGETNSQQWYLEPDYYFSNFRIAWRLTLNQPDAAGSSTGHQVTGSWYYTDTSRVSLLLSTGKETEGIRGQALVTEVDSVAVFGRHYFQSDWAFEYSLSYTSQGDFYNRTGVEIGVLYRF